MLLFWAMTRLKESFRNRQNCMVRIQPITRHPISFQTMAFGAPLEEDEDLLNRYKMEIVDRDDVKAWIKMTRGKARLSIQYREQIQ